MIPHPTLWALRALGAGAVLVALVSAPLSAQTSESGARAPRLGPHASDVLWVRPPVAHDHTRGHEPLGGLLGPDDQDYRYTGFFVGVGAGLAAVALAVALCSESEGGCDEGRVVLFAPLGVAAVGLAGAVVGGLFPKHPHGRVNRQ